MCSYNLKYDHYNEKLSDGLQTLYATSDISDITLAVEGKFFRAHQVILSIFSPYFKELFCQEPSKHTIFFMKNVKHRIMGNLLAYMYEGTVRIPEKDMQIFIETANELKIKGLTVEVSEPAASPAKAGQLEMPIAGEAQEVDMRKHQLKRDAPTPQTHTVEKRARTSCNSDLLVPKRECSVPAEEITCLVDVGPTEIHFHDEVNDDLDGEEFDNDGDADTDDKHNISHMQGIDENSSVLENMLASQPIISGESVTVTLCKSEKKQKINAIIVDSERYGRLDNSPWTRWTTWLCTATNHKCKRRIILTDDDRIIFLNEHNHVKRKSRNLGTINSSRVYFSLPREDWMVVKKEMIQPSH